MTCLGYINFDYIKVFDFIREMIPSSDSPRISKRLYQMRDFKTT